MKLILGLCATLLLAGCVAVWRYAQTPDTYGQFDGASVVEVAPLVADPSSYLEQTVIVEGDVRHQCKVTGCFFSFVNGDKSIRVELEKIAPQFPQREGHRARVEGRVTKDGAMYEITAKAVEFL